MEIFLCRKYPLLGSRNMKEDYLNEKDKERKIKSRQLERKPKNQASKKNTLLNNTKSFLSVLLICPQLLSQDL
jgi:hypothetical protein